MLCLADLVSAALQLFCGRPNVPMWRMFDKCGEMASADTKVEGLEDYDYRRPMPFGAYLVELVGWQAGKCRVGQRECHSRLRAGASGVRCGNRGCRSARLRGCRRGVSGGRRRPITRRLVDPPVACLAADPGRSNILDRCPAVCCWPRDGRASERARLWSTFSSPRHSPTARPESAESQIRVLDATAVKIN